MPTADRGTRAAALTAARRASARYRTGARHGISPVTERRPVPSMTFAGGAGTSTGSRYLVAAGGDRVLVDCGMFAGPRALRRRNWSPVPPELHTIDAIVLTSPDLEHCGFLPQLVAEGWSGPVFATPGTAALVPIALTDAACLSAEEAAAAEIGGWTEHHPALPPFRLDDVGPAVELLRPVEFGTIERFGSFGVEFGSSGSYLGSAWVRLDAGGRTVVFSGTLGGANPPVLSPPEPRPGCDVLVLGAARARRADAGHEPGRFASAVHRAVKRGGTVLVPASAVGLTEVLLTMLRDLMDAREIPLLPVYLDSPTGLSSVAVHDRAVSEGRPGVRPDGLGGVRLPEHLLELRSASEATWLEERPSIIVAGPATAGAGRVLGHLATLLPDARNAVLLVGPQVPGTRAELMASRVRQVKIRGRYVPVRAEITEFGGFGKFADQAQVEAWATAGPPPETTYVVEGEPEPSRALAKSLHAERGWCAVVPDDGERVLL